MIVLFIVELHSIDKITLKSSTYEGNYRSLSSFLILFIFYLDTATWSTIIVNREISDIAA